MSLANPYLEMQIRTASPLGLVVQLYDGALRHIHQARAHHDAERLRERGHSVSRAIDIVAELRNALDMERGEHIARNLDALYAFTLDKLLEANLRGDPKGFDAAIAVLEPLRSAWVELAARPPEAFVVLPT